MLEIWFSGNGLDFGERCSMLDLSSTGNYTVTVRGRVNHLGILPATQGRVKSACACV